MPSTTVLKIPGGKSISDVPARYLRAVRGPAPIADALIAATARAHALVLVTRNAADFACTGIEVVNPWPK